VSETLFSNIHFKCLLRRPCL